MGFDVLAFEAGLYDMHKAWERLRNGEPARIAVPRGLSGIWSASQQVQPLIDYVGERANSSRPLELAGFDTYVTGRASGDFLVDDLMAFLNGHGIDTASIAGWANLHSLLVKLSTIDFNEWRFSEEQLRSFESGIDLLTSRITALDTEDARFWRHHFKNMKAYAELRFRFDLANPNVLSNVSLRDVAMGNNFAWLAREAYPQRKIIVWAATFHTMRNPQLIDSGTFFWPFTDLMTMGHIAWQSLGTSIFNVAFASYEGEHARAIGGPRQPLPVPPEGSIEDLLGATRRDYSFLDLRRVAAGGEWLQGQFASQSIVDHDALMVANWSQVIDAILFTRTMRPSTRVSL
jgi:erythromycin esterase